MSVSLPQSVMGSMVQALVDSSGNTQNEVESLKAVFDQHRSESSALNTQLSSENQRMQAIIAELQSQLAITNTANADRIQALENRLQRNTVELTSKSCEIALLQERINTLTTANVGLQKQIDYSKTEAGLWEAKLAYHKLMQEMAQKDPAGFSQRMGGW